MARKISYRYNKQEKTISFANDKYHDLYHAVAAAEGIDFNAYLKLEHQVGQSSKGRSALRNFREEYFKQLGITQVSFIKE